MKLNFLALITLVFSLTLVGCVEKALESAPTNKDSVQDLPSVVEYTRVDFVGSGIFTSIFIYPDNSKWYLEKPLDGIYETDKDLLELLR